VAFVAAACAVSSARSSAAEADAEQGGKSVQLSVSGQHRTRFEVLDPQFRPTSDTHDQVLALRTNVVLSAAWPRVRVVGEIVDSRAELNDEGSTVNTSVVDTFEPVQAYVEWTPPASKDGVENTLKAGRITLDLGKRRLVARNRYRNTLNSFVGVDWSRKGSRGQTLRAFYLRPMRILPSDKASLLDNEQRLDKPATSTNLWGAFYALPAAAHGDRVELYALALDADEPNDHRDLTTLGARVYRGVSPGKWHYEVEAMRQTGTSTGSSAGVSRSDLDHDAYFGHFEVGYTFTAPAKPDLMFQYDTSSGDRDPNDDRNERFDTLYGARRFDYGPTGIYGPFSRANLESSGLRLTFNPAPRWDAMFFYRSYRLQSATDAWTTTGLRDVTGQSGDSLGRQLETRFRWDAVKNRLGVEAGYAYFSKGSFVERTDAEVAAASNYFYSAVTVSF
jgi:hypothetical protein